MPPIGQFGRYEILEQLGGGGMGDVYRARDTTLGRLVAIKVIRAASATDPERLARFEHEARAASALSHPNIVTIYEIGSVEAIRYIAMELVEGRTLREILLEGPLLTRRALQLAAQAANGLAQAHEAGIVHRDLKPENIMVTPDSRVKILDFGLAKLIPNIAEADTSTGSFDSRETPSTRPGTILGTVAYMSPEQAMGLPLDFRSDQFSCGAILYEMATGRPPFRRGSAVQTLAAIIEDEPEPIADLSPAVPAPLRWIVERCLAKAPSDRYASTRDMARDLANVLDHLAEVSSGARPSALSAGPRAPGRRRAGIVTLLILLSAGITALWTLPRGGPSARGGAPARSASPAVKARRSVAVLGFKNLSGRREAAWLSAALSEMLTTELAAGGGLRTIPGENVGRMKMELALSDAESLATDTLARVGRNLGTDMVLLGSYVSLPGERIRLDVRLQDVATGDTVASMAESGTEPGVVDLVARVGSRLRHAVGVGDPPTAEAGGVETGAPTNREAQRLYGEGLARLRVLDALAARELLQKAVAADPDSATAHSALADAWTMLGHDARAREEAQRASDLGGRLSREERLCVEGRYREIAGEWDKAIEIYAALLAFFPDNVEYGLRLADAQGTAGKGQEALATLARLRSLPPPLSNDPRIDLSEAGVAQALGDFRRQQAAAARAAAKGDAQGARLLVARARLREAYAFDRLGELPKASIAAESARQIFADAGDRAGLAGALNIIGSLSFYHGDLEKARTTWEECLRIRRQTGYRSGVGASLHNLGLVLWDQGDLAGARRNLEEAYAIGRELGDQPGVAIELVEMAGLLHDLGDLPAARKSGEQAGALFREIGDPTHGAVTLKTLALVLQAEGELTRAKALYREALPVLREKGTRDSIADTLFQLGELLLAEGDLAAARQVHEEALAIRTGLKASYAVAKSQLALAGVAIEDGHPEAAEPLLRSATAVFATQRAADWEALAHAADVRRLLSSRRPAEALKALESATALAGRSQSPQVRLAVAAAVGRVNAANGRIDDARRSLDAARAEAARLRLLGAQLDLQLARAEIEFALGGAAAAGDLARLAAEARAHGFGLVARKVEALQRGPATKGGGAS